ncbi:hypothetical protein Tco_1070370 [Tanacetum coccineum]|uniref:Reverse transcriptase domain-containing protein n=1 Tax=Tanacetum coccineum TaxID=301880 RepID=A0ABQ5HL55_9ASTR
MSGNPSPSSDYVVESPSPSLIPYEDSDSLVEETDTLISHFNNSSPDYETFCFNIKEKSSGSTTSHSDYSLPDYDAFYFDDNHIKEKKKEQEPETITEVVEIASSKSTPLVLPPETLPFGGPTLSLDPVVKSLFPSLTPSGEIDLLLEVTGAFLSLDDSIPPGIDNGIYDSEGDILFLEELLNNEILSDLPPKELKDDEPSTTKSLIEKLLEIDNEIYDSEGDIPFLENLLKDDHSDADKSEIYTLIGEPPDTFLIEDKEIKLNPLKDSDNSVPIPRVSVTPLDSLDSFFDLYDTSYTNLSDLDSESTLNYDNQIFKF